MLGGWVECLTDDANATCTLFLVLYSTYKPQQRFPFKAISYDVGPMTLFGNPRENPPTRFGGTGLMRVRE